MAGYVPGMDHRKRARLNKSTTSVNMRQKFDVPKGRPATRMRVHRAEGSWSRRRGKLTVTKSKEGAGHRYEVQG